MYDVPWDVNWNRNFEKAVARFSDSGEFYDNLTGTIEKIIREPVRTGKYKEGGLKNFRQTHVEQHVIIWGVEPGVPTPELTDKVEEVYFYSLDHHDEMDVGDLTRDPVEKESSFEIQLQYSQDPDPMAIRSEIFGVIDDIPDATLEDRWEDTVVVLSGTVPTTETEAIESVVPDSGTVCFDDPTIF